MEKFFASIGSSLVTVIIGTLFMLLLAHIIIDVDKLFKVGIASVMPYPALLGLLAIIQLIRIKAPKKQELQELMEEPAMGVGKAFGMALMQYLIVTLGILLGWFAAYVLYWIAL